MNLSERLTAIEGHLEVLKVDAENEYHVALAAIHAELAKLEAAVLAKVADVKNTVKNAAAKV
jgi:hypothetical protein